MGHGQQSKAIYEFRQLACLRQLCIARVFSSDAGRGFVWKDTLLLHTICWILFMRWCPFPCCVFSAMGNTRRVWVPIFPFKTCRGKCMTSSRPHRTSCIALQDRRPTIVGHDVPLCRFHIRIGAHLVFHLALHELPWLVPSIEARVG